MDFQLTEANEHARERACAFGRREVAPSAAARDRQGRWERELFLKMGTAGLLGVPFPSLYGGKGGNALELSLLQEGFGEGSEDAGLAFAWGAHTLLCGVPLLLLGTESQRQRYLPRMCTGEWVGGLASNEREAGSEVTAIRTHAVKRGDRWLLNGTKTWVTNGPVGHHFVVTAQTDPDRGAAGISAFIVERGFSGFRVGNSIDKLGLRTATTSELVFEACEVPADNLLGDIEGGASSVWSMLARWERSCLFAHWLGLKKSTLDRCTKQVMERTQFGRPINHFQSVRTMLVDMKIRYQLAKQLTYRAAYSLDQMADHVDRHAAMAKLYISESAQKTMCDAIQLHGTRGLATDQSLERAYRDAMPLTITGGNSQILRSIVAGSLLHVGGSRPMS